MVPLRAYRYRGVPAGSLPLHVLNPGDATVVWHGGGWWLWWCDHGRLQAWNVRVDPDDPSSLPELGRLPSLRGGWSCPAAAIVLSGVPEPAPWYGKQGRDAP